MYKYNIFDIRIMHAWVIYLALKRAPVALSLQSRRRRLHTQTTIDDGTPRSPWSEIISARPDFWEARTTSSLRR